jgi:hypothetical protein
MTRKDTLVISTVVMMSVIFLVATARGLAYLRLGCPCRKPYMIG